MENMKSILEIYKIRRRKWRNMVKKTLLNARICEKIHIVILNASRKEMPKELNVPRVGDVHCNFGA